MTPDSAWNSPDWRAAFDAETSRLSRGKTIQEYRAAFMVWAKDRFNQA